MYFTTIWKNKIIGVDDYVAGEKHFFRKLTGLHLCRPVTSHRLAIVKKLQNVFCVPWITAWLWWETETQRIGAGESGCRRPASWKMVWRCSGSQHYSSRGYDWLVTERKKGKTSSRLFALLGWPQEKLREEPSQKASWEQSHQMSPQSPSWVVTPQMKKEQPRD